MYWHMPAYDNSQDELVVIHQHTLSGKIVHKNLRRVQGAPISHDLHKLVSWLGVLMGRGRVFDKVNQVGWT